MSKRREKKNLKSSLLVLLLIAILLIASTYAWFTANTTVTISSLNVTVEASNGLQISTDAVDWKAIISNEDIATGYSNHKNQIPIEMEPVSTVGGVTDDRMRMFYGTVAPDGDGDNALTAKEETTETAGDNGKYIAFDIFLKADKAMTIDLTNSSSVTSAETEKGLQNATRVAFLVLGHGGADTAPATAQGWKTKEALAIWEPNAGSHTTVAAASANSAYFGGATTVQGGAVDQTPITYYGVKDDIGTPIKLSQVNTDGADTTYFTKMESGADFTLHTTNETMTPVTGILSLAQGITKVRVYMWVEGQDVDCDNSASGSNITFNVQLEVPDDQLD